MRVAEAIERMIGARPGGSWRSTSGGAARVDGPARRAATRARADGRRGDPRERPYSDLRASPAGYRSPSAWSRPSSRWACCLISPAGGTASCSVPGRPPAPAPPEALDNACSNATATPSSGSGTGRSRSSRPRGPDRLGRGHARRAPRMAEQRHLAEEVPGPTGAWRHRRRPRPFPKAGRRALRAGVALDEAADREGGALADRGDPREIVVGQLLEESTRRSASTSFGVVTGSS